MLINGITFAIMTKFMKESASLLGYYFFQSTTAILAGIFLRKNKKEIGNIFLIATCAIFILSFLTPIDFTNWFGGTKQVSLFLYLLFLSVVTFVGGYLYVFAFTLLFIVTIVIHMFSLIKETLIDKPKTENTKTNKQQLNSETNNNAKIKRKT